MPDKDKKLLKYKPVEKSFKVPFIVYEDFECLLGKIETCQSNPKKPSTEKRAEHTLLVTHGLHVVHLINQKANGSITEEKIVSKCFVKI